MDLQGLIEEDVFNFTSTANISELIASSINTSYSHIPIFEDKNLLGMIKVENLYSLNKKNKISDQKEILEKFYIMDYQSILDAIKFFEINKTNILPVINSNNNYLGNLYQTNVVDKFSKNYLFSGYGETILIAIEERKYSMREISNIVEYNNGKIIGIFITKIEQNLIEICVKFTSASLTSVVETFERYEYRIVDKFFSDFKQEMINERYNYLINYINK